MAKLISYVLLLGSALLATAQITATLPYAPGTVPCPGPQSIRDASNGLSPEEASFVATRRKATIGGLHTFFSNVNIPGFNAHRYIQQQSNTVNLPNISLAFSGGGYRAMLTGAGAIKAFDSREHSAPLGGLLQSSIYITGLSGGSWLLSSIYLNNFATISSLQKNGTLWNLTSPFYAPVVWSGLQGDLYPGLTHVIQETSYKLAAGFPTSLTDIWGRLLSQRFLGDSDFGVNDTWSGIKNLPGFAQGQLPLPIITAEGRINRQTVYDPTTTTTFEFSPFEFGSWDTSIKSFVDTQYIGSDVSGGATNSCVQGYDQAGFVLGTSSSLFNPDEIVNILPNITLPIFGMSKLKNPTPNETAAVKTYQKIAFPPDFLQANYDPNPFSTVAKDPGLAGDNLALTDGGSDGQTLPLMPLVQRARDVDVIVAIDAANEINGWPNGTSLGQTVVHQASNLGGVQQFMGIPDAQTFINLGLNKFPAFFGCHDTAGPIIVYIPNAPYITYSNTSTFQFEYTTAERDTMIENGYLAATRGNGSAGSDFKVCMGCAILSRSLLRTKTAVPTACQKCLDYYCYPGPVTLNDTATAYDPSLIGASPDNPVVLNLKKRTNSDVPLNPFGFLPAGYTLGPDAATGAKTSGASTTMTSDDSMTTTLDATTTMTTGATKTMTSGETSSTEAFGWLPATSGTSVTASTLLGSIATTTDGSSVIGLIGTSSLPVLSVYTSGTDAVTETVWVPVASIYSQSTSGGKGATSTTASGAIVNETSGAGKIMVLEDDMICLIIALVVVIVLF